MARLGDIRLRVDKYFTESRVRVCAAFYCRFNAAQLKGDQGEANCMLKQIEIDRDGKCKAFEVREKDRPVSSGN